MSDSRQDTTSSVLSGLINRHPLIAGSGSEARLPAVPVLRPAEESESFMVCPHCQHIENRVLDSRLAREDKAIKRRRECAACGRRWTTFETAEVREVRVVKRDGRREAFDRSKIQRGLEIACRKRPVSMAALEAVVDSVERQVQDWNDTEISSEALGEMVIDAVKELDPVAYVRFASVYRDFQDLAEFQDFLGRIRRDSAPSAQTSTRTRAARAAAITAR